MHEDVQAALARDRTIDITTTGRSSGRPHRIEIWFHNVEGRFFITGLPGRRSWYANLLAEPQMTFHLKESVAADLAATAIPVTDPDERRIILGEITPRVGQAHRLDAWVKASPLVEVQFS